MSGRLLALVAPLPLILSVRLTGLGEKLSVTPLIVVVPVMKVAAIADELAVMEKANAKPRDNAFI